VDAAGEQRDQGRRLTVSTGPAPMTDGDRLNKPFSKAELLARVAALLTP